MTYLAFPRLAVTCLVHVGERCCFVVLVLGTLYIDVLVPGSLFAYRCNHDCFNVIRFIAFLNNDVNV